MRIFYMYMDEEDYLKIVEDAPRLDKNLFNLSSEDEINALEKLLDSYSEKHRESMIGVPLVQPYGGPTCEYVLLPEKKYWEMRKELRKNDWHVGCNEIGIPYNKRCFQIKRKNLKNNDKLSPEILILLGKIKRRTEKIKVYKNPTDYYL